MQENIFLLVIRRQLVLKKIITILLASLVAGLLVSLYFFYLENTFNDVGSVVFTNTYKQDWDTYEGGSFSFEYPTYFKRSGVQLVGSGSYEELVNDDRSQALTVEVRANYNNASGKVFSSLEEFVGNFQKEKQTKIFIDGYEAIRILPYGGEGTDSSALYVIGPGGGPIITLDFSNNYDIDMAEARNGNRIFNQIVSTLRFNNFSMAGWRTYKSRLGFEFQMPDDFASNEGGNLEIYSPTTKCETSYTEGEKEDISEAKISFTVHEGDDINLAWLKAFGYQLEGNFDGEAFFDGHETYYFYQGAEMVYGRTAYLVDLGEGKFLEINKYSPNLVFNCDQSIDNLSAIDAQILSTLRID
ncbi:hypothetical protein A2691_01625 [Candidatus Woesebacteria bacterium RIFCSPHIGHO2_01_FULL_39_23]|nr:MAG: hypothetical protein A2691_01625 [Candidatus Woesebacteria bacterium RIFCSPHIGHO2_01_FULL_39_23]